MHNRASSYQACSLQRGRLPLDNAAPFAYPDTIPAVFVPANEEPSP